MLTLSLLRHAKSSWSSPSSGDFDRPLGRRGLAAAPLMGRFMARRKLIPDLILCSGARRTRQTLELLLPMLEQRPAVTYDDELYLTGAGTLLTCLGKVGREAAHIMLLGHNPGLQRLALHLAQSGEAGGIRAMAEKFPTAALAVLTFNADDWRDIERAGGRLELFMTPSQLG